MVKVLFLGLLVATMCVLSSAVPVAKYPRPERTASPSLSSSSASLLASSAPDLEDPATRSERSTNLSYITGTARKIQLFIKNRHLQLLPDGTVNGTLNASSNYTVLQRMTVGIGRLKIQGVATCQYLCMDACGLLYGSREFSDECIFHETIEHDHYNTYSSIKYSNDKRTLYLAMNRRGQPRKVMLKANQKLGKLSSYTRVLTRSVTAQLTEHVIRHQAHHCLQKPTGPHHQHKPKCQLKKKKKKKKRKCTAEDPCNPKKQLKKKCDDDSVKCQRVNSNNANKKGRKKFENGNNNNNNNQGKNNANKKKKKFPNRNSRKLRTTTTEVFLSTTTDPLDDDYYGFENSTHWEWEDSSTVSPEDASTTTTIQPD